MLFGEIDSLEQYQSDACQSLIDDVLEKFNIELDISYTRTHGFNVSCGSIDVMNFGWSGTYSDYYSWELGDCADAVYELLIELIVEVTCKYRLPLRSPFLTSK